MRVDSGVQTAAVRQHPAVRWRASIRFWKSKTAGRRVGLAFIYAVLIVGSIAFALPFYWMIATSFKTKMEAVMYPPKWVPIPIHFTGYERMWTAFPFARFLTNTCFITITTMIGFILTSTLVGYGFARTKFKGRDALFLVLLATMMLPPQVTMIPTFIIFRALGWINTYYPLIVPAFIGGSAFYIFLMRQFIMTLPRELDDAARIDGCNSFRIYWNILMPLSKPAIATIAVFSFVGEWNDFMGPLIYLQSQEKMTIAVGLRLFVGQFSTDLPAMMAGSFVTVLPLIVIFFLAQNYFVQGIALTGLKQ